jgi:hypothetical protein
MKLLLAAMAFIPSIVFAADPAAKWTSTPSGDVILRPFDGAPYPHASRADGYTSKNGTFPKDPHYVDSTVGIVIPKGYVPGDTVDYVVHFHGWSNHVSQVLEQYRMPQQLAASGVNAILLVPQGPKDAKDSSCGKLELDDGAFKRLISEVTKYLNAEGKIRTSNIGRIALSAHSGGYKVTARILHQGGLTDHISDVLLLDASYGNLEDFAEFCANDRHARLISLHTEHLDAANKELMGLLDKAHVPYRELPEDAVSADSLSPRGVTFISTKLAHNEVPMKSAYFERLLATSALPKISKQ